MKKILLPEINYKKVQEEIENFIIDRTLKFNLTGAVMGISGGVDSTLVASLTKSAYDKYNLNNEKKLELIGYLMPSKINNPKDLEDGLYVCNKLGINYRTVEISNILKAYELANPNISKNEFVKGNLMSEIRATILHSQAGLEKKIVMGTGNQDEDFGIGYYTLFGDGAVHASPIGNLSKRLVRELTNYMGFVELSKRIPTAGLENNQTDMGDLGYSYNVVEVVTEGFRQGFSKDELYKHPQILEFKKTKDLTDKFDNVIDIVDDIYKRHTIAKSKANLVSPPICVVTKNYK